MEFNAFSNACFEYSSSSCSLVMNQNTCVSKLIDCIPFRLNQKPKSLHENKHWISYVKLLKPSTMLHYQCQIYKFLYSKCYRVASSKLFINTSYILTIQQNRNHFSQYVCVFFFASCGLSCYHSIVKHHHF